MRKRYSYSEVNARKFKGIFDKALALRQSLAIKIVGTPTHFHQRCSDALKWLIDNNDGEHKIIDGTLHEAGSYAMLRGMIKLREIQGDVEHLHLLFNKDAQAIQFKIHNTSLIQEKNWKDKLIEYIEDPSAKGKKFQIDGLILNQEDIGWAENLLKQVCIGAEDTYFVSNNLIVAIRR